MDKLAVIIPAAGSGSRLETDIPKPYIQIAGASILEHTVRKFLELENLCQIVIATSFAYLEEAERILLTVVPGHIKWKVVEGGKERQDSIYNALQEINGADLVAIHDAVRPFIQPDQIKKCCKVASACGGAIIAVPAKDTIKRIDKKQKIQETPDRSVLWQAQTPQIFRRESIIAAYQKAQCENFRGTDDSSLAERANITVKVIEGDRENFKITYPLDLQVAKILLE